jgi:hypothetical protein
MMMDRRIFLTALSVAPPVLAKDDFWNIRKPEEWTDKEIEQLLIKSPWSREVTAEFSMGGGGGMGGGRMGGPGGGMGGPGGGPGGGMGGPGGGMGGPGGGMGGPGGGMGGPGGGMGGPGGDMGGTGMQRPSIKAQVRWESALPVRLASKRNGPSPQGYVLSVSGLPMMMGGPGGRMGGPGGAMGGPGGFGGPGGAGQAGQRPNPPSPEEMEQRRQMMVQRVRENTRLERKGKDPIAPEEVQLSRPGGPNVLLFAFPKTGQPIVAADKEVTFITSLGPLALKAKFALKDMLYQGQLEL